MGAALGSRDAASLLKLAATKSLAEFRAAGANEEAFPTVEQLLKLLAELLSESHQLWRGDIGTAAGMSHQRRQQRRRLLVGSNSDNAAAAAGKAAEPDYATLPVLLMDLKGRAFSPAVIRNVSQAAAGAGVTAHVALYVLDAAQAALARNASWAGPLIVGFMVSWNAHVGACRGQLECCRCMLCAGQSMLYSWHSHFSRPDPGAGPPGPLTAAER